MKADMTQTELRAEVLAAILEAIYECPYEDPRAARDLLCVLRQLKKQKFDLTIRAIEKAHHYPDEIESLQGEAFDRACERVNRQRDAAIKRAFRLATAKTPLSKPLPLRWEVSGELVVNGYEVIHCETGARAQLIARLLNKHGGTP